MVCVGYEAKHAYKKSKTGYNYARYSKDSLQIEL